MPLTAINLADLAAPQVVQEISFEDILLELRNDAVARYPEIEGIIDLESEPTRKLLEVYAYRETLLRAETNDNARAIMVATAVGSDLENLAAFFGVTRAAGETDARLRKRVALAVEAFSAAGPVGAYRYHAMTASPDIRDVSVVSPSPGQVMVTLLSDSGSGAASAAQINAVREALNAENVRPLTDVVSVRSAEIVQYEIKAGLTILPGPASAPIIDKAKANAIAYADRRHNIGRDITASGLFAALHVEGVQRVDLKSPTDLPLEPTNGQAAYATSVKVEFDGRDQ